MKRQGIALVVGDACICLQTWWPFEIHGHCHSHRELETTRPSPTVAFSNRINYVFAKIATKFVAGDNINNSLYRLCFQAKIDMTPRACPRYNATHFHVVMWGVCFGSQSQISVARRTSPNVHRAFYFVYNEPCTS
jgi:hypothetical protein